MDRGTTTDEQTEEEQISNRGRANFEQRKSRLWTEEEQIKDQWQTDGKSQIELTRQKTQSDNRQKAYNTIIIINNNHHHQQQSSSSSTIIIIKNNHHHQQQSSSLTTIIIVNNNIIINNNHHH